MMTYLADDIAAILSVGMLVRIPEFTFHDGGLVDVTDRNIGAIAAGIRDHGWHVDTLSFDYRDGNEHIVPVVPR